MSAADPIRYVSIFDEAIDRTKSRLRGDDGYEGTLDRRHLVMLPGARETTFVLRWLDYPARRAVNSTTQADARHIIAVMWGLESIETPDSDRAWRGSQLVKPDAGERQIWHQHEIAEIEDRWGMKLIHEIGNLLLQKAERGNAWSGSVRPYTLPQYLWDVLAPVARPAAG